MRNKCLVNRPEQRAVRQLLRKNQTVAEAILWQYLRGKDLKVKFVRQYGIENYVAVFCCRSKKLIIEIDGGIHDVEEIKIEDQKRTNHLENLGFKIIRFKNEEILNELEKVLVKIKALVDDSVGFRKFFPKKCHPVIDLW
ncbi:MAG: endonuclease domain-containing protein [Candidatus Uhrbacteria bacterium]